MRTKAVRPFPGRKVDRLPSGFAKLAISEACKPGGLPRTELTRISGQNCKWSLYLDEIAKGAGYDFKWERRSNGRVHYFMRQQAV
jgi:hypothetical protein